MTFALEEDANTLFQIFLRENTGNKRKSIDIHIS